jgi:hypothetical protein
MHRSVRSLNAGTTTKQDFLQRGFKDLDPFRSFLSLGPVQLDERRGGMVMSSSFRMSVHRWDDNLKINVMGDFDESSANELISALHHHGQGVRVTFIRTGGLKRIRKRAKEAFHNYILYRHHDRCHRLVFPSVEMEKKGQLKSFSPSRG